jgi:hypothetical protein
MRKDPNQNKEGYEEVFTKKITLRNGRVLLASEVGLTVFHFWAKPKK